MADITTSIPDHSDPADITDLTRQPSSSGRSDHGRADSNDRPGHPHYPTERGHHAEATYRAHVGYGWRRGSPAAKALTRVRHTGGKLTAAEGNGRFDTDRSHHQSLHQQLELLHQVPHRELDLKRRIVSMVAKVVLVSGDAALLSIMWFTNGAGLLQAMFAGIATAVVVIAVGSMAGRQLQLFQQRRRRGPKPGPIDTSFAHLFTRADDRRPWSWLVLGVITAFVVVTAITWLGFFSGDALPLALAAGLFAALSLVGSAAAEAYGTNAAAETEHQLQKAIKRSARRLEKVEKLYAERDRRQAHLESSVRALEAEAAAAALSSYQSGLNSGGNPSGAFRGSGVGAPRHGSQDPSQPTHGNEPSGNDPSLRGTEL